MNMPLSYFITCIICALIHLFQVSADYHSLASIMCRRICLKKNNSTPVMIFCYFKTDMLRHIVDIDCVHSKEPTEDREMQTVTFPNRAKTYQRSTLINKSLNKRKLFASEDHKTWSDASLACKAKNMSLLTIDSEASQKAASEFLIRSELGFIQMVVNKGKLWLGLRDIHDNNKFLWSDHSSLVYTNWAQGEPSHESYLTGIDEDCVSIVSMEKYVWNDNYCEREFGYVCEMYLD